MPRHVSAVVFEGGNSADPLVREMAAVRQQVVLDNLEKMAGVREIEEVVLVTCYRDLAEEARTIGTSVMLADQHEFHFGFRLREVINSMGMEAVIYMGGAGVPLISPEDLRDIALSLKAKHQVVYLNNVQSADIIAFSPALAINDIDPPDSDNLLGWLLGEAGLEKNTLPALARLNFDLDTPTDMVILSLQSGTGARTKRALRLLSWPTGDVVTARDMLGVPMKEIVLVGRVGSGIISFINSNFQCRLRVFSEERGMKALGREKKGGVVSLLGFILEHIGPEAFFGYLSRAGDAAFIDSRVLMAHGGRKVSDSDRYNSDLCRPEQISDPMVKRFTEAAMQCPIPVVLGGHSLVCGGLWLLGENLIEARNV